MTGSEENVTGNWIRDAYLKRQLRTDLDMNQRIRAALGRLEVEPDTDSSAAETEAGD